MTLFFMHKCRKLLNLFSLSGKQVLSQDTSLKDAKATLILISLDQNVTQLCLFLSFQKQFLQVCTSSNCTLALWDDYTTKGPVEKPFEQVDISRYFTQTPPIRLKSVKHKGDDMLQHVCVAKLFETLQTHLVTRNKEVLSISVTLQAMEAHINV